MMVIQKQWLCVQKYIGGLFNRTEVFVPAEQSVSERLPQTFVEKCMKECRVSVAYSELVFFGHGFWVSDHASALPTA